MADLSLAFQEIRSGNEELISKNINNLSIFLSDDGIGTPTVRVSMIFKYNPADVFFPLLASHNPTIQVCISLFAVTIITPFAPFRHQLQSF